MKDYLTILAIILSVATPALLNSQEDYRLSEEILSTHILSGSINNGFLIPHHKLMKYYPESKTTSFTLSIEKQLKGEWAQNYGYLSKGVEVSRSSLSNAQILGFSTHLVGYAHFGLHSKSKGRLKFGGGVAVISQKFDLEKNVKNIAIGTTLNAAIVLEYSYRIPIYKELSLSPQIRLVHFSNGAYKLPNLGLNLPSIGLRVEKRLSNLSNSTDVVQANRPKKRISLCASIGRHELASPATGQFLNSNLTVQYLNDTPKKILWGAGLDIQYSGAYENYLLLNSSDSETSSTFTKALRAGVHGAFGLKLGVSQIHTNLGYYLLDSQKIDGPTYQRIYFQSRCTDFLDFRIGLKAHIGKAETFELGLVTNLWSK